MRFHFVQKATVGNQNATRRRFAPKTGQRLNESRDLTDL